ncbi:MAG: hypothetical protein KJN93_00555, partial [Alphaproteobacteria bacterium]|nr:hypothetical protein [Alphaproteobacteria bacterium]
LGQAVAVPSWTIGGRTGLSAATGQIIASLERAASMVEGPITVVGHGAGAWLATRLADPGAPLAVAVRARIGAIAALSPVLDLRPLAEIADEGRSEARTTAPGERSPKGVEIPLGVWMASAAPAALQDNASALVASAPASVPHTFPAGHFDIMETLRDPGSAVLQRLLA